MAKNLETAAAADGPQAAGIQAGQPAKFEFFSSRLLLSWMSNATKQSFKLKTRSHNHKWSWHSDYGSQTATHSDLHDNQCQPL